ncbi:MAG: Smr/MutS family protein [Bacteroidaceae bacterium]|nr:Smr/MutS family protein [Bacteroidaceae bacterium]
MIYPSTYEEKTGMTEVRAMLKAQCLSPLGQQRVDEMTFLTDCAVINELHQQAGEMVRIMEEEDRFPDQGFYDLRPTLQRIRIEGTYMEADEMFALKRSLETIGGVLSFLTHPADTEDSQPPYPALSRLVGNATAFPQIIRHVDSILDKFGKVKDNASKDLAQIRHELASTQGSISRVLQQILRNAQAEGTVAADVSPTMRDGRLVIPVAPALKRKLKGIVHDESATGRTVFIEPQEVVEANNRIRELEGEERREIIRILREFTAEVRPLVPHLLQSYEMLADVEFVRAKARLALAMNATTTTSPQIADAPLIDWTLAVHPLLRRSLEKHGKQVVPLEIELTRRQRILIISGPNAGGKSVCLKTVGLLQYMLQCGLPITVGERSQLGIFNRIMLDIGDEQSIEDELSTYSSHLVNMKQMMRQADPATLLLIDEFGGGTEPQIGGAMAEAVLKRFVQRGAFGVITTHYQNLKHFAEDTEGVANAAMLYDRHQMKALFQLQIGHPGSSFAVEIARKIGIPEDVIADASDIVGRDYINADKWLQDIVRDRRYWEGKRQTIHTQEKQMQQTIERYEHEMADLGQQRKEILRRAKEEAEQLLQEANARIENTIREIREAQAEKEQTRRIRQQLDTFRIEVEQQQTTNDDAIERKMEKIRRRQERKKEKAAGSSTALSQREGATSTASAASSKRQEIESGAFVRIKGQTSVGTIERIEGKEAIVLFGQMRTQVKLDRLVPARPPKKEEAPSGVTFLTRETQSQMREKSLHFRQDIDVRGMRGDEALNAVTLYIDDAIQVGVSHVRILHGTGNGILRQLIRQYLKTVPAVADAHDEHVQFGGSGITVVDLR